MSRSTIILIVVILAILAALFGLSRVNTEVAPQPVEQPVENGVLAQ